MFIKIYSYTIICNIIIITRARSYLYNEMRERHRDGGGAAAAAAAIVIKAIRIRCKVFLFIGAIAHRNFKLLLNIYYFLLKV